MTTFTTIPDSELAVDAPARSINALQLRDNPIAITEGAAGAPRIVFEALEQHEVAAGSVVSWSVEQETTTTSTSYVDTARIRVVCAGTIRFQGDQKVTGSGSCDLRIRRNNSTLQTWNTTSTSYVTQQHDFTVNEGDVITVQFRKVGTATSVEVNDLFLMGDRIYWCNSNAGA